MMIPYSEERDGECDEDVRGERVGEEDGGRKGVDDCGEGDEDGVPLDGREGGLVACGEEMRVSEEEEGCYADGGGGKVVDFEDFKEE